MKVALGTVEVPDAVKKAIRKLNGGNGHATREEVRTWTQAQIGKMYDDLVAPPTEAKHASLADTDDDVQSTWTEPDPEATTLPEPYAAGDSTPSSAPPTTPGFSG